MTVVYYNWLKNICLHIVVSNVRHIKNYLIFYGVKMRNKAEIMLLYFISLAIRRRIELNKFRICNKNGGVTGPYVDIEPSRLNRAL